MSQLSQALELEVAALRAVRRSAHDGRAPTPREKASVDRHMARLMRLLAPRIRHFTRAYGLLDVEDDARQACAIGVMRAVEIYDPAKASFTTLVNWQLRGELQGLRYRLRSDYRESARAVGAQTVSLHDLDGAGMAARWIADAEALDRAEALASEVLARRACGQLLDEHLTQSRLRALHQIERRAAPRGQACIKPGTLDPAVVEELDARLAHEREITRAYLLGDDERPPEASAQNEQRRQIARRTIRALTRIARGNPRYDPEAEPQGATRH